MHFVARCGAAGVFDPVEGSLDGVAKQQRSPLNAGMLVRVGMGLTRPCAAIGQALVHVISVTGGGKQDLTTQ